MKKTFYLTSSIFIVVGALVFFVSCYSMKKIDYYSERSNYIDATGVVTHIRYNDSGDSLYLGFTGLSPTFDDNTFKIVGKNLTIVQRNGIDQKIKIGDTIQFVTAPKYFGDGYVMPIVSISVNGDVLLEFEEGTINWLAWLKQ